MRMEVLRAGLAHRKPSGHILAIVTIITNPMADVYIALCSLQSIFRHVISLGPGGVGGGGVSTELLGQLCPAYSGDGCHWTLAVFCLVNLINIF